jgi:hypothetical protein
MSTSAAQIPKWSMEADYVETCNCDYGCPCNFNGFPTYGFCRALVLYHVRKGSYGSVRLDGIDVVFPVSWPKAIHEGNGTTQLFVSKKATDDQRSAVLDIFPARPTATARLRCLPGRSSTCWSRSLPTFQSRLTARRAAFRCQA